MVLEIAHITVKAADFQVWRNLVSHCFASPPEVQHVSTVVKGF